MLDGASRRFARQPPKPDPVKMQRFKEFVAKWLKKHMTPLSSDADTSFETWISNAPYPLWRKNELRRKYEESVGLVTPDNVHVYDDRGGPGFDLKQCEAHYEQYRVNRYCRVNSFQKDETYPTYKPARAINSRTDEFKVLVGPIFKLIEKELFKKKWFIKKIPVDERASFIKEHLSQLGAHIIGTDYTAYECVFTREFMECCEFQLYDYMTRELPDRDWYNIVTKVMGGDNLCQFRNKFTLKVEATRMSGEMCTSLGNSFANLMSFLFIAEELRLESVKGEVEGDDGIFTFFGPLPTTKDFESIGLIIKIDVYDQLTEGSFCGIIADDDDMINVTDPITAMLDFGWTSRQYVNASEKKKKELLKAKSLSLAYQYPGCPILSSLAQYGLRMTQNSKIYIKDMCEYEREIFTTLYQKYKYDVPVRETGFRTRLLVEKRYGISVQEQIEIETYLDNKVDLSPIDNLAVLSNCHRDSKDYYDRYVFEYDHNVNVETIGCPINDDYSHKKLKIFDKYEKQETKKSSWRTYKKKADTSGAATSAT